MQNDIIKEIENLIQMYPALECCWDEIIMAYQILRKCFSSGHKLLIAGNGGSASDADHIVGELMKEFRMNRKIPDKFSLALEKVDSEAADVLSVKLQGSLPAIALHNHGSLNTAFLNDVDGILCFAQQTYGYGKAGDVFLGISTSGNSQNVYMATVVAKAQGMSVISMTGKYPGNIDKQSDVTIHVPETETYRVQEMHMPIYHCLCLMLEKYFWMFN